jgi:hypothetical protein
MTHHKDNAWAEKSEKKIWRSLASFVYTLRRLFPERFNPTMPEMVLTMGSGDYPQVRKSALPHLDGVAPVLMFGSAFRDTGIYRNMLVMPMPADRHLTCFVEWVMYEGQWRHLATVRRNIPK